MIDRTPGGTGLVSRGTVSRVAPVKNTALEAIRCRSCRYLVAKTDRNCSRCGAPITTRNIVAGHVTALVGALGIAAYGGALGYTTGRAWLMGVGIGLGAASLLGVIGSIRQIYRLRGEFPTARARLEPGASDPNTKD